MKRSRSWPQRWGVAALALLTILGAGTMLMSADDLSLGWAALPIQAVGLVLTLAALVLTMRARFELGESFAPGVEVWKEQELRTRGLFALVRHPMYLGAIAMWLGAGLGTSSWLLLVAGGGVMIPAFYLLARAEEHLLVEHFGHAYRDYQRRVPMLWPWPRPRGTGRRRDDGDAGTQDVGTRGGSKD